MFELSGWLGGFLLAICGFPQMVKSIRDGNSKGIDWTFLIFWFSGEILTLIYVMPKKDLPLILNYIVNIIFVLVIGYYKISPRIEL